MSKSAVIIKYRHTMVSNWGRPPWHWK